MRKRIEIRTVEENNHAANVWIEHLVTRIVVEQLNLPPRLQAKLLYETLPKRHKR